MMWQLSKEQVVDGTEGQLIELIGKPLTLPQYAVLSVLLHTSVLPSGLATPEMEGLLLSELSVTESRLPNLFAHQRILTYTWQASFETTETEEKQAAFDNAAAWQPMLPGFEGG
jgi:hypothetical protein